MSDEVMHDAFAPVAADPLPKAAMTPTGRVAVIDALLRTWMVDCIHNTTISQDTEAVNYLTNHAIPLLARRILAAD